MTTPMAAVEDRVDTELAGSGDNTESGQVDAQSELEQTAEQPVIEQEQESGGRALLPFLAAAGVVGVILVAIVLAGLHAPRSSESDRVVAVVQAFVAAHNNNDRQQQASTQCPGFDQAHSPLADSKGRVGLIETRQAQVAGDHATMSVTTQADNGRHTADWQLVKAGAGWRVCG